MTSFFITNKKDFKIDPEQGVNFRKCQLGAIWALKSHFTKSNKPGLISMPTGSGKTALMMALAFELKAKRVLIITPSRVIRDQIAIEFSSLDVLKKIGALPNNFTKQPIVKSNKSVCNSIDKWNLLNKKFDVVVATPKTVSPIEKGVVPPPQDLFDLVFFDEAHHAPAATWNELIETFKTSNIVLLTATPFRRDKKRIKGTLVYHYSISNAIGDGIYSPIEYIPITSSLDKDKSDRIIAEAAVSKFNEEIHKNSDIKIIIKTETIEHAEFLKSLYIGLGISVNAIHNKKTDRQNNEIIMQCRNDNLKGIICVGMIGEGLDIPELKIAVLHAVPRTLPFTIQLIGRVSRVHSTQKGNAFLIADPEHVKGEVNKLYKYDKGWFELIPNLVDRKVSSSRFLRDQEFSLLNPYDINTNEIEPFFSVRIYKMKDEFRFRDNFVNRLAYDLEVILVEQGNDDEPLIVITCIDEELAWGKKLPISHKRFDLHIFLVIDNFLFEYTTSDYYCNKLKRALLVNGTYERADYSIIKNGLKDTKGREYYMIGMDNSSGVSKSNPKYKIYLGKEVQSALRITDGRIFSLGHALAKISEKETRGIAPHNSRIWSVNRDNISVFRNWCNNIYELIRNLGTNTIIPQMEYLADTKIITALPSEPISILFNDNIFNSHLTTIELNGVRMINSNPSIEITSFNKDAGVMTGVITLAESSAKLNITYCVNEPDCWSITTAGSVNIYIDFGNNEPFRGTLQQYLNEYSPLIILSTGQTIKNNLLYTPKIQSERFNQDLFVCKTWAGTDVKKEADTPRAGYSFNVQQKTIEHIKLTLDIKDLVIIDDRANEVADIITIRLKEKIIEFYHCKFKISDGLQPGANKLDVTELIDQGIRNGNWIYSANLIDRLIQRIGEGSILSQGTLKEIRKLNQNFFPNQWSYKIVLVQPGIKKESVFPSSKITNIEKLLCTLYDRTESINASLEIWGS